MSKSLVIGPAWVGDMVMAQALYKALALKSTSAEIHVVAPQWSRSLLTRMAEITNIFNLDVAHGELGLSKRIKLGKELRQQGYDQAIILPRSFKSALVPWAAKIPQRFGDAGEMRSMLLTKAFPSNRNKAIPNVCNYLKYIDVEADINRVKEEFIPELTVDQKNQSDLVSALDIPLDKPLIACMVGAEYGPSKQWPPEHFARLIDMLSAQGLQACILGAEKDKPVGDKIESLSRSKVLNLCGKTTLVDVIDLLALCKGAVSNDSGLMHIAAAVDVPVIVMYGATTPSYTPPLHKKAKTFYLNIACSPCWQRTCQYEHYRCLKDITPVDVLKALVARIK